MQAINQRIHRLDLAKRRIKVFNRVALCIAVVCIGSNIVNLLSNRNSSSRRVGSSSVLGEAFQSVSELYGKKKLGQSKNINRQWALFGKRSDSNNHLHGVPKESLQPFGSYPNILNITSEMRKDFHPVIKLPPRKGNHVIEKDTGFWPWQKKNKNNNQSNQENDDDDSCIALEGASKMNETYDYIMKDYTGKNKNNNDDTVLLDGGKRVPQLLPTREEALEYAKLPKKAKKFDVGRYDEDRRGMYTSSLFAEEDASNWRTVHIGIDIGAPVGTTVYAFTDGTIHSAGYNEEVGDYGHVIVIDHILKNPHDDAVRKVYALYGHLGAKGIKGMHPGQKIKKGQAIGYLGNTAENGGWTGTHVHFQLAVNPPPTHDMPGVVAVGRREEALLEYLDPRYVLGELY